MDEEPGVFSDKDAQDHNTYFAGRVHNHNVVIASLPAGVDGTTATASVATDGEDVQRIEVRAIMNSMSGDQKKLIKVVYINRKTVWRAQL